MAAGLIDADLGGSVYKKRVPMAGRGKRGGARTSWVAILEIDGFSYLVSRKNDRATVDARELAALQTIAASCLPWTRPFLITRLPREN